MHPSCQYRLCGALAGLVPYCLMSFPSPVSLQFQGTQCQELNCCQSGCREDVLLCSSIEPDRLNSQKLLSQDSSHSCHRPSGRKVASFSQTLLLSLHSLLHCRIYLESLLTPELRVFHSAIVNRLYEQRTSDDEHSPRLLAL